MRFATFPHPSVSSPTPPTATFCAPRHSKPCFSLGLAETTAALVEVFPFKLETRSEFFEKTAREVITFSTSFMPRNASGDVGGVREGSTLIAGRTGGAVSTPVLTV